MADTSVPDTSIVRPSMSGWRQAALSLFWFGSSAHWTAILITLLPLQAARIGESATQGSRLGLILSLGALISMVAAPLIGIWSDRSRSRWGRRKPFMIVGTLGNVLGLLMLALIPSVPSALYPYMFAYLLINLFNNIATAPYSALIPELIPSEQRGAASGWMGLMQMLGSFLGGVVGLLLGLISPSLGNAGAISVAYLGIAVLLIISLLGTLAAFREPPLPDSSPPPFQWQSLLKDLRAPFRSRDFSWVFWTRFLITLGTFTVQTFILYYMQDVIAGGAERYDFRLWGVSIANDAAGATSMFILALLIGAILSSLVAGRLSDRYGRKPMVYLSGGLQGLPLLLLIFTRNFEIGVVSGILFGLGYGAYNAVDWALGSDVLPSQEDFAKDMGIWHIAMTLPQSIAAPIAGVLLDTFQAIGKSAGYPTLGYTVIFLVALIYFFLGTVLIRQVKGVR